MNTFKISSLILTDEEDVELFKEEFERYPDGMPIEAFRDVVASRMPRKSSVRPDYTKWERYTRLVQGRPPAESGKCLRQAKVCANEGSRSDAVGWAGTSSVQAPSNALEGRCDKWVFSSEFETFFNKVDANSDGLVSWEDVLQLAVEEATHSITVMAEEMRSYSLSRKSPPMKLIQMVHTLSYHKSLFAVVSRADPLTLLSRRDFSVVKKFNSNDFDNTYPELIEYLPMPDVLLAYSASDKKIRGWWCVASSNRTGTLNPLLLDDTVRRIRTYPSTLPYSFFTAGSRGNVAHWQIPKQRSVAEVSQTHSYEGLHPRNTGGITDFVLTDEWLLSTGFDHRLLSTNLETGRSILIGHPFETIRFLDYNRSFACVPTVSYSNQLLLWDVRSSALTPGTIFTDDSAKQHVGDVIGLRNAPGLPQVITADSAGWVKVWDLRMLRCVQTFCADGSVGDTFDANFVYGLQSSSEGNGGHGLQASVKGNARAIRSLGYFQDTQEIVCSSSEAIHCFRYNYRREGLCTDVEVIQYASYDLRQETFVLQGATRTSVWDAADGYRKRIFDRATDTTISYWQHEVLAFCLDSQRSRAFFAVERGLVEVRSSKDFALMDSFQMHDSVVREMLFSTKHRMLICISVNGTLTLRSEVNSMVSTIPLSLSSEPLHALTLSDEVGLIGCCDSRNIFVVDFKQTKLYPLALKVNRPVRTMELLGRYPVLATGDDSGELILWSMPPVEEGHVPLASVFIGKHPASVKIQNNSRTGPPLICVNSLHSRNPKPAETRSTSPSRPLTSLGPKSHPNDTLETSPVDKRKKKNSLNDLLHTISSEGLIDDGITAISFDEALHRLFVMDQKGNMFIYSLCPFILGFGFQHCLFEKRTKYRLLPAASSDTSSRMPLLLRKVSLHKGPINFVTWIPELNSVVSCGSDQLVKISNRDGEEAGVLLMNRIPSRHVLDEMDSITNTYHLTRIVDDMKIPYSLPSHTHVSKVCEDCARITAQKLSYTSCKMEDLIEEAPQLPLLRSRKSSGCMPRENRPIMTQLGDFVSAAPTGIHATYDREIRSSPPPPPSPTVFRFVAIEEKKQWHPRREKPCTFWDRAADPSTRPTRSPGERGDEVRVADVPHRSTPHGQLDIAPHPKLSCMFATQSIGERSNFSSPLLNAVPNTVSPKMESLTLSGVSALPSKSPLMPVSLLSPSSPPIPQTKLREGLLKGGVGLKKRNEKRMEKCRSAGLSRRRPKSDADAANGTELSSDDMLRIYNKELHRCIRGRGGMERLYKSTTAANPLRAAAATTFHLHTKK